MNKPGHSIDHEPQSLEQKPVEQLTSTVLADQLRAEGVRYVFGSIASTSSPIATALRGRGEIDYVVSMNEEIAGLMALGYGQASGRASVLSLSGATGLMNGLSSLYAAQRCRIPMVAIAIDQDSGNAQRRTAVGREPARARSPPNKMVVRIARTIANFTTNQACLS